MHQLPVATADVCFRLSNHSDPALRRLQGISVQAVQRVRLYQIPLPSTYRLYVNRPHHAVWFYFCRKRWVQWCVRQHWVWGRARVRLHVGPLVKKRADRAGPETYYVSVMDIWRHRASKLVFVLVGVGDNDEASLPSFLGLCAYFLDLSTCCSIL
jgi:hypothetical protein